MKNNIVPFYTPTEKTIIRSEGCYLYDSDGRKYTDFESGVWCANLGHCNEMVNRVIKSQIKTSIHHGYRFRNFESEKLSRTLQDKMAISGGQSVFLSSGSEAVNLAITLARHLMGRQKVLKIRSSYLSAYGHGKLSLDNDLLINLDLDDLRSLEQIDLGEVCSFVMETGGASFDMVFPSKEFVLQIVEKARDKGCLIISDEVTTGMGRTGKWFGFQHYDLIPDIVATGKGLGNGYPVSGVTINSSVAGQFRENPFRYAQSHQNDPLGCAIGLEVIRQIERDDLINKSRETGRYFNEKLLDLREKYPGIISAVRARGLMLAMQFDSSFNGDCFNKKLFENGFTAGFKNNIMRFLPPLTIDFSGIDRLAETIENLFEAEY